MFGRMLPLRSRRVWDVFLQRMVSAMRFFLRCNHCNQCAAWPMMFVSMSQPSPLHIVIAPDSFKESLSALAAAEAMAAGFCSVLPQTTCRLVPMADGGEGTVDAVAAALNAEIVQHTVTGPLGAPVHAAFAFAAKEKLAVVEMAAASGLHLVPMTERNPLLTTSYGTGEQIRAAIERGARRIIVALGGTATVDGAAGILQAMGAELLDADGQQIARGGGGLATLKEIKLANLQALLDGCSIELACDVTNPLLGPEGAAAIFGPQKGATPAMVIELESNLKNFAESIERAIGRDVTMMPGGGAAGGAGAGLMGCANASMVPGGQLVADAVKLEDAIRTADLVLTGEGRFDAQTARGKTPAAVAAIARRWGKPVYVIAGSVSAQNDATLAAIGVNAAFSAMLPGMSLDEAMRDARQNVSRAATEAAQRWRVQAQ